ncbi:MAG: ABC transporter permease [Eubacterium sp.]|nr:ABC transporter permease [Eubacterium sp.]
MLQMIQSELYRIRKNRFFFLCLLLSAFFMSAYVLSFHYDTVKTAGLTGGIASLNGFTQFLFSDYSLVIPITIFQLVYVAEDYQKGVHEILFIKGVSRFNFFFGKLFALWITVFCYLIFSFFAAYILILSIWIKQPHIECSPAGICGYLILQMLCFVGYSSFLWLLSCIIPYRNIVLAVAFFLLGTLYLYLTKISTALDLEYSLYQYWIVGLSDQMEMNPSISRLPAILITIAAYILFPTGAAYWMYQKADLRKRERR